FFFRTKPWSRFAVLLRRKRRPDFCRSLRERRLRPGCSGGLFPKRSWNPNSFIVTTKHHRGFPPQIAMISHIHPRFHRIRSRAPVYFLLGLLTAVFLAGCFPAEGVDLVTEREERSYLRGKQLLREGRRQEALSAF